MLSVPRTTFYRWYERYRLEGQDALQASGRDQADVVHKPRLLSDNGSGYISVELADWLEDNDMIQSSFRID